MMEQVEQVDLLCEAHGKMNSIERINMSSKTPIKEAPVPLVPSVPVWLDDLPAPKPAEPDWRVDHVIDYLATYQPRPVTEKVPALVEAAFDSAGVEVQARWEAEAPPVLPHGIPSEAPEDTWESATPVENVPPCPSCGSLELWQDFSRAWHCQRCEPPSLSCQLARKAAQLRAKAVRRQKLAGADG